MGIINGQNVDQAFTNAGFMDKNQDTFTIGIVSLNAPTSVSGPFIADTQKTINAFVQGASGVFTLSANGGAPLTGAVNLAPSGVVVIQSVGQDVRIYAPPSGAAVNTIASSGGAQLTGNVVIAASGATVVGQSGQNIFVYSPASGAAVNSIAVSGQSALTGAVTISSSGAVTLTQSGQNIQIFVPNSNATGVTAIGTLDSQTKSSDGAVVVGSTLYMQTADSTNPGLSSTGAQSFLGAKTFLTSVSALSITGASIYDNGIGQGGIVFGGAGSLLTDDTSNLFWDNTNKFLGIGTNTPGVPLEVGNGGAIRLDGTSGHITIQPAVTTTSYLLTLPNAQGALGTFPQNDGSGNLSWVNPATSTVYSTVGSRASPVNITAAGGISFSSTTLFTTMYIQGNGGNIIVTATPQIGAGLFVGQKLYLIPVASTATVTLTATGTGINVNGPWTGDNNNALGLEWDSSNWYEMFRRQ